MIDAGIEIERQHHEVATAGQAEIDFRFDTLVKTADRVMMYKYIVKNVARAARQGRDLHAQAPLRRQRLRHARPPEPVEGRRLPHVPSRAATPASATPAAGTSAACCATRRRILAFAAPTTNSYKRLVPGFEAPVNLVYSARNRSGRLSASRCTSNSPKAKRIEFRAPDPTCNPYLAFAAMLMAGIDGVMNKIEPDNPPLDKNTYELSPREQRRIKTVPGSLDEALDALERDNAYLLKGGVFTAGRDRRLAGIQTGRAAEVSMRPHPYEFHLYFDA